MHKNVKKVRQKQCIEDFDLALRLQDVLGFILIILGQLTHRITRISYHAFFLISTMLRPWIYLFA